MKRIYASAIIVAALLVLTFYSSWRVQSFSQEISTNLDGAVDAVRVEDYSKAREAMLQSADLCGELRSQMSAFLRTRDFTELEASLRAADSYLELRAPEEALSEMRRAQVQTENLSRLAKRFF